MKEPLARLYEERIAAAFAATEEQERQAKSEEMKEVRRLRGQSYAEEIKLRKRSMGSDRSSGESSSSRPRSGWSDERPMSEWEIVINQLASPTTGTPPAIDENKVFEMMSPEEFEKDLAISEGGRSTPATGTSITLSSVPHLAYGKYSPSGPSSTGSYSPALRPLPPSPLSPHFPTESISPPSSSAASLYNEVHPALRNDIHPALRSAPHSRNVSAESDSSFYSVSSRSRASMQHPMQAQMSNNAEADLAANSSERAIFRIVEMGWTADEARHALMVTDLGDGLRIDRAVELLLRQ